jgi:phage gpG-like protein
MTDLFFEGFAGNEAVIASVAGAGAIAASYDYYWSQAAGAEFPGVLANNFGAIDGALSEFTPFLVAERQIMIDDVSERFITETDPYGRPWQEWADSYRTTAASENVGILRKTEQLYEAVTSPAAYPVADTGSAGDLFLNTGEFPDYWAVQNYGGTVGRGAELPPRQFIGPSPAAIEGMTAVHQGWVNGILDIGISGSGVAQFIHPGSRQFGQRISAQAAARLRGFGLGGAAHRSIVPEVLPPE